MRFGFPGDNLHLENHGVSEESFWPSFTDIMMVIVMVFLLVTVTVLLNNWTLITDLKQSVKEQKEAASIAKAKQQENKNLASNLTHLKQQFVSVTDEKKSKEQKLTQALSMLTAKQAELATVKNSLKQSESNRLQQSEAINALQANLNAKEKSLEAAKELSDKLISNLSLLNKEKDEQVLDAGRLRGALTKWREEGRLMTEALDEKATLLKQSQEEQALIAEKLAVRTNDNEAQLLKLSSVEKVATELKTKLKGLLKSKGAEVNELVELKKEHQELILDLETTLKEKEKQSAYVATLKKSKSELKKILTVLQSERNTLSEKVLQLENKLSSVDKASEADKKSENTKNAALATLQSLKEKHAARINVLEKENKRLSGDIGEQLTETEEQLADLKIQLESKDAVITALQKERVTTETQLLSLKGEYDTLDTKYQKLLRPARSSKGKYVVSVLYKKSGRKRIIRLKINSNGRYKTVSKATLHKELTKLKKKHKTDLYIKVIIPRSSGLLHNEAWKFTSSLQRRYDYYSQPESSK